MQIDCNSKHFLCFLILAMHLSLKILVKAARKVANAYGTRIDLAPSDDRPMEDLASVDIMKVLEGDRHILYQGTSF